MMKRRQQDPTYMRQRGLYLRSVGALLVFQALCWAAAAGLAYLILSPELAKDYFSAHRTVKETWRLLVPGLAVAAAVGFVLAGVGSAWSVWSHSRRQLDPLRRLDALLREFGVGRIPRPQGDVAPTALEREVAAALAPLAERLGELRQLARGVQKVSLELNYRSAGTAEVTLKDLRALAAQLDELSKELTRTSDWFQS